MASCCAFKDWSVVATDLNFEVFVLEHEVVKHQDLFVNVFYCHLDCEAFAWNKYLVGIAFRFRVVKTSSEVTEVLATLNQAREQIMMYPRLFDWGPDLHPTAFLSTWGKGRWVTVTKEIEEGDDIVLVEVAHKSLRFVSKPDEEYSRLGLGIGSRMEYISVNNQAIMEYFNRGGQYLKGNPHRPFWRLPVPELDPGIWYGEDVYEVKVVHPDPRPPQLTMPQDNQ